MTAVPFAALTATAMPVAAALLAGLFAARLGGSFVARPAPYRLFWALGFLLFAAGAAAEAYGASGGWSPAAFRIYYLCGGILTVAFLGLGSAWLHLPRAWALVALGALLTAVPAAAITVLSADVDVALLATGGLEPPPNDALDGLAYLWAIALNTVGTLLLIGGSLRSARAGHAPVANLAIVAGVAVVALSGVLTRLGSYGFVYAGQLAGITLMYVGFELASRPARRRRRGRRGLSCAQRGVAQPGRALRLGRSGRPFESARPDRARVPLFRRARAG